MEVLQLILNVVGITGITSLSLICYLVKRDNLALASEVRRLRQRPYQPVASVVPAPISASAASAAPAPSAPKISPQVVRQEAAGQDVVSQENRRENISEISRYVAQRSQQWAALPALTAD